MLPINDDDKKVNFDSLEKKIMDEIEAKAEVQRQKMIIKGQLDQENTRMMSEMMGNINKSQLYGLSEQEKNEIIKQCEKTKEVKSISKRKEKFMAGLLVVIIILLTIGITPSGSWYETIQTNYVETLVDIFKVSMIGVSGYLVYKLFKRE